MTEAGAEKIARNDSTFRDANEQIEGVAKSVGLPANDRSPFICECSDPHCVKVVALTLDEYRHVRSNPRWFVHASNHETSVEGLVRTVEQRDGYTLVEKIGEAGDIAAELAPERVTD